MKKSRIRGKAVAATLTVGAMVATGMLTGASSASAAGASACSKNTKNVTLSVSETVHLRTGPGKRYTSRGLVGKENKKFYKYCERGTWSYGKVLKGAHKGKKGWISDYYLGYPMNPPGHIPG